MANLLFYFVPVVSAVGGWALLGETIPTLSLVGFGVIFAGFLLVSGLSPTPVRFLREAIPERSVDDNSV